MSPARLAAHVEYGRDLVLVESEPTAAAATAALDAIAVGVVAHLALCWFGGLDTPFREPSTSSSYDRSLLSGRTRSCGSPVARPAPRRSVSRARFRGTRRRRRDRQPAAAPPACRVAVHRHRRLRRGVPRLDERASALPGRVRGGPGQGAPRELARAPERDRRHRHLAVRSSIGRGGGGDRALLGDVRAHREARRRRGPRATRSRRAGAIRSLFRRDSSSRPDSRFHPFTDDTPVAWVEGGELPGGAPAFLPAELVYLGAASPPGATSVGYATSSGLACGETPAQALVRGLFELLERDAFMILWSGRLSLPLLELGPESEPFRRPGWRFPPSTCRSSIESPPSSELSGPRRAFREPSEWAQRRRLRSRGRVGKRSQRLSRVVRRERSSRCSRPEQGSSGTGWPRFEDHIVRYADHGNAPATAFLDANPARVPLGAVTPLEGSSPTEWLPALCEPARGCRLDGVLPSTSPHPTSPSSASTSLA